MKRYYLTWREISRIRHDATMWTRYIRRREARIIFKHLQERRFKHGLELGAGNGEQSTVISRYCDDLVATDVCGESYRWLGESILDRRHPHVRYELCDAQDLSRYGDGVFDVVYSSNVLEHIDRLDRCLGECRRVLADGGLMIHAMPSRYWKVFRTALFWLRNRRKDEIHGAFPTHGAEFLAYGLNVWKDKFKANGFNVVEVIGLPFYVGLQNQFISLIQIGNALRIPASFAYFSVKL